MAEAAAETTKPKTKPGLGATLASLRQPRVATAAALGFSSGLPFLLTGATFGYWMRDEGIALTTIGFLSWVGLAYTFKFLWSPLVDRLPAPVTGFLGQRRGWVLFAQAMICAGLVAMAIYGPKGPSGIVVMGLLTLLVAVSSATQDIVIDAWRIETAADSDELGLLTAAYQLGYRAAIITSDAIILFFAQHLGWPMAYGFMAVCMSVGVIATLRSAEPKAVARPASAQTPKPATVELESGGRRKQIAAIVFVAAALCAGLSYALKAPQEILVLSIVGCIVAIAMFAPPKIYNAVVGPFSVFVKAHGSLAVLMLAMISLYRLPEFLIGPVAGPFYSDLGLSKDIVGGVRGTVGLLASVLGITAGGFATIRFGYMPSLIAGAVMQGLGVASYAMVAAAGVNPDVRLFALAMVTDNFCYSFAGVALITYMSSLTSIGYTATQYAFLSSVYTLFGKVLKGFSGAVVDGLHSAGNALMTSYAVFYVGTGLICLPALALCLLLAARVRKREAALAATSPPAPATG